MINISSLANFLSLEAKEIENVSSIINENGNFITITLKKKECFCPSCHSSHYKLKEYYQRKIKHALFLNIPTTFLLRSRKYRCLECGRSFVENNNLAPKKSRVSFETIYIVLKAARAYNAVWKEIANKAHVSDTTAINIFDRYVNLNRGKMPRVLSIDECYNKHQFQKPYSCILFDFLNSKIVDVIEDRSKVSLGRYLSKISREERLNVEYVIIDMWEPYLDIASIYFPNATTAIDSFHVLKEIGFALDKVRRRIMSGYRKGSEEYYLLKKWNNLLFSEQTSWGEKMKIKGLGNRWYNKYQLQQKIIALHPDLKLAQEFYILYKRLNQVTHYEEAEAMIDSFINYKNATDVKELISIIQMLINWKEYIVNSFMVIDSRRLSNGPIEGFNSNFKKMMTVANGLYSFSRFRNRLMYCYNKPNCLSPTKERIKKRPRGKRGAYKKAGKL
jgi:transposase